MSDKRLTVVLGLPGSGTSIVAGMLHHLGVNMGRCLSPAEAMQWPNGRQYLGYECMELATEFGKLDQPWQWARLFSGYCQNRLRDPGPQGVKMNRIAYLFGYPELAALPIRVIHVRRDLEETFRSDLSRENDSLDRAALLGTLFVSINRFIKVIEPTITVWFDDAMENPTSIAMEIAHRFNLESSSEQVEQAAAFVDPVGRGVIA